MAIKHRSKPKTSQSKKTSTKKNRTVEVQPLKVDKVVKTKAITRERLKKRLKRKKTVPRTPVVLPSVWQLSRETLDLLLNNKKLFFGITIIYGILDIVLANQWASAANISTFKTEVRSVFSGHASAIGTSFGTFISLGSSSNTGTNSPSGVYEFILLVIASLAIIWAIRRVKSQKNRIRIRDAYYKGMFPLIRFILVVAVIGVQLLPIIIGSALYATANANGIAVGQLQRALFLLVFAIFTMVSLYWLSASIFGLYEVTKPGATPGQALKQARHTVRQVRWLLVRKVMFLPIALLVVGVAISIPFVLWLAPLIQVIYFMLSIIAVPIVHVYLTNLYGVLEAADEQAPSE